jgi:4-hydroxy-2-oxoheptanedioate aldolase
MNRLRQSLASGCAVIAVNAGGVALPVIDMIARGGADCLFIDCERTAISVETVPILARAARAAGLSCVVRSESPEASILLRYLDCGIDGLVVPQVESAATCDRMGAVARVFGKGDRSGTFLIAQIESVAGRDELAAITGHPDVDLILIGPNDLAHSMGFSGDTTRPELQDAVKDIAARVTGIGKPFGLPVTIQSADAWTGRGARFLYTNLEQFVAPAIAELRSAAA